MKLTTLKPRLATIATQRIPTLTTQEVSARPAGRGLQRTRERIQTRDDSMCCRCGLLWQKSRDEVEHLMPRWAGGSDEDSNLALMHKQPCHADKTRDEEPMRRTGVYVMPDWVVAILARIEATGRAAG